MGKRILIIDDDTSVRMLFTDTLTDEGFEVDTAMDGVEGLEKLKQGGYDLVLLDVMMPKLDGIGILTELAEHKPAKENKKIVLFTSLHDDPAVKEGLSKGAHGFIVKSDYTPEVLIAKIKSFLEET